MGCFGRSFRRQRAARHGAAAHALPPEALEARTLFATFVVTSPSDEGPGTLREAIMLANNGWGRDLIGFNLPAGEMIRLQSELPQITDPVAVDGTTQPGYAGTPLVRVDGSQ